MSRCAAQTSVFHSEKCRGWSRAACFHFKAEHARLRIAFPFSCTNGTLRLQPTFSRSLLRRSCVLATASAAPAETIRTTKTSAFHNGVTYTYYECNSFGLRLNASGVNILVDPWLVDDLVFYGQDKLFRGRKKLLQQQAIDVDAVAAETDLILVTQHLNDHFHEPTMRLLPKHLPIVCSPAAAFKARAFGFTHVFDLPHGKSVSVLNGKLHIRATAGAEVGPPWVPRENGFVLEEVHPSGGLSVYYEPHCNFSEASLKEVGHVDVVVSPITSQVLGVNPIGYSIVEGADNIGRVAQLLTPKVILATMPGDIVNSGFLTSVIYEHGSLEAAQAKLKELGLNTRIEMPAPSGEALAIAV